MYWPGRRPNIICFLWGLSDIARIGICERAHGSSWHRATTLLFTVCISECKADCDTCFTRNFCTKCKSGFYLYSGKCLEKCPDGLEANNHTMECTSIGESAPHVLPCFLRGGVGSKEGMISYHTREMKMFFITRYIPQYKTQGISQVCHFTRGTNLVVCCKNSLDAKGNSARGRTACLVCPEAARHPSLAWLLCYAAPLTAKFQKPWVRYHM